MRYIYYIDGEKFKTNSMNEKTQFKISSFDENTPAFEDLITGQKLWCNKGLILHRLTGPADIFYSLNIFFLNGKRYETIKDWLKDHPEPDLYFHNIGVFTETDKVLWYLQN
jgi:hypothetical protein